jgi:hypothetical protein
MLHCLLLSSFDAASAFDRGNFLITNLLVGSTVEQFCLMCDPQPQEQNNNVTGFGDGRPLPE